MTMQRREVLGAMAAGAALGLASPALAAPDRSKRRNVMLIISDDQGLDMGALGVAGYLGYLSYQVFQDSLLFPLALSVLGLGVVALGIWWQRHEAVLHARLSAWVPVGLRPVPGVD